MDTSGTGLKRAVVPERKQMTVLEEAQMHVDGARQSNYGTPHDNHTCTAKLFAVWRARREAAADGAVPVDALDVCVFNICQKLSRMANDPSHRDNLVDIAGYVENIDRLDLF